MMPRERPESATFINQLNYSSKITRKLLEQILNSQENNPLSEALKYAALGGGKGLRSFLALKSAEIFDVPVKQSLQAAVAIELIHCYSLIHDDLPAMDNDDLRRGRPTLHKKWDEATAILVGDGLQALAYEVLAEVQTHEDSVVRLELISSLALASGFKGMVGGQALDILAEKSHKNLTIEGIEKMQNMKTGALFVWATEVGARMSGNDVTPFTNFAQCLGLAFQIQDDILDITGKTKNTGKALRKDMKAGKATFVSILGLDEARMRANQLVERAIINLEPFGEKSKSMRDLARFAIERTH